MAGSTHAGRGLPDGMRRVLAVVAHPGDESFGLGGLLALLSDSGVPTAVLCFTHGESSTLHGRPGDLRTVRAGELACAVRELGVEQVELAGHPDGALDNVPVPRLAAEVTRLIGEQRPTHLLVFDTGGVTGHRDHQRATRAALFAAREAGAAVVAWTLPRHVAERLNAEFGTSFRGRDPSECRVVEPVPRERQRRAVACHASGRPGVCARPGVRRVRAWVRWRGSPRASAGRARCRPRPGRRAGGAGGPGHVPRRR